MLLTDGALPRRAGPGQGRWFGRGRTVSAGAQTGGAQRTRSGGSMTDSPNIRSGASLRGSSERSSPARDIAAVAPGEEVGAALDGPVGPVEAERELAEAH